MPFHETPVVFQLSLSERHDEEDLFRGAGRAGCDGGSSLRGNV